LAGFLRAVGVETMAVRIAVVLKLESRRVKRRLDRKMDEDVATEDRL
jgi:hypothetical protein